MGYVKLRTVKLWEEIGSWKQSICYFQQHYIYVCMVGCWVLCSSWMGARWLVLTPILVSSMWGPIAWRPSLLARVIWCGWAWAGRGYWAGQVGIHVIRVCAAYRAAAGWRWWHRRHAAHTEWSATRIDRLPCEYTKHHTQTQNTKLEQKLPYLDFLQDFPREAKHESKRRENINYWNINYWY